MKGLINDLVETAKLEALYELETVLTEPILEPLISCDLRAAAVSHHSQRKNKYRLFPPGKAEGTQGTGQGLWGAAGGAGRLVEVRSSRQGFLLKVQASPSPLPSLLCASGEVYLPGCVILTSFSAAMGLLHALSLRCQLGLKPSNISFDLVIMY